MQGIPPTLLDDLAGAQTVTIATGSTVRSTVPVVSTVKAVEALRRCSADQLVEWGADPAQFAPGGKVPIVLKSRDDGIPSSTLLAIVGQTKRSAVKDEFRVAVTTDGVVDQCHAVAQVTEPGVEKTACAAVLNKRLFAPARNADGSPVRGAATFRVTLVRKPS